MAVPELIEGANGEAMPIAIVGIGCRLPGSASSPEKLWDMVARKQSARRDVPPERFNVDAFYHPNADKNGTMNNRGGYFLDEDISAFDAPFFSISPAEAVSMDPMQRILLEVTYEAIENAGIPLSTLAGSDTGCYVGCFFSDYDQITKRDPELLPKYHSVGTGQAILSNRISFCFNLNGPSLTLDTACSSSLVALHLACQSLRTGESKAAIVGASNAILNPDTMIGMTNLHFLSPDSTCHTFDTSANGYARGEGMAAVVLKPLDHAIRDGDTVRAVIRGTAINSIGSHTGITVPKREAQVQLIRTAYRQAGCDPAVTAYCEAHGTGTQAGDPVETSAIGEALGACRPDGEDGKLYVGSIKTNIGHLEGASGLAGLIKAVMSLERGLIAPNLGFDNPNPAIDFDAWRIRVPTDVVPWPVPGLRRASVNSFGYGGANGHVVLDDAYHYMRQRGLIGKHRTLPPPGQEHRLAEGLLPSTTPSASASSHSSPLGTNTPASSTENLVALDVTGSAKHPRIFHISAHEPRLVADTAKAYADRLAHYESQNEGLFLDDLAFTLCERRSRHTHGASVVASSQKELIDGLRTLPPSVRSQPEAPLLGFVFTGQGAQWWAMGRELTQYPTFSRTLDACSKAVQSFGSSWSLLDELFKDQKTSRINEAEISQPLCTALQIALVDLYASWNIHPARVVGHSSGEIAAAYATGALTLESAMRAAYLRGLLSPRVKDMGFKGGMLAAGVSEEEALKEIRSMKASFGKIVVACVNSPRSVTLSGDITAVNEMQNILTSRQAFARKLQVETAYHSHHMEAIADEYRHSLGSLQVVPWNQRKQVKMFSSVYSREITDKDDLSGSYWVENMVSCVRFSDALSKLCQEQEQGLANPVGVLLELGPHSALAGPVKQVLSSFPSPLQGSAQIAYFSAIVREKVPRGASVTALEAAASLYAHGYPVDLHSANFSHPASAASPSVVPDLPTYTWNHGRKYWSESRISHDYRFRQFPRTDVLGAPSNDWNPLEPRWRNFIRLSEQPWVRSHVVQGANIYPAAGFCCMAIEAIAQMNSMTAKAKGQQEQPISEYKIRDLEIRRALVVPQTEEGIEVIFSMLPEPSHNKSAWREFRVFSYTLADGWAEHCRGMVTVTHRIGDKASTGIDSLQKAALAEAQKSCTVDIPVEKLYAGLESAGLYYGPEFQGVSKIAAGKDQAFSTVEVTDTASGMPNGFEFPRLMHPATMDTFLQIGIVARTQGDMTSLKQPHVPIRIQEISISGGVSALSGQTFQAAAVSKPCGFREVQSNVTAISEDGKSHISMDGIKFLAMAPSTAEDAMGSTPSHTAIVAWEPDLDLLSLEKTNNVLRSAVKQGQQHTRTRELEFLAFYYFNCVLNEIGEAEVANMHPHHQKFFHYMKHQRDLVLANSHEQQTEDWSKLEDPSVLARIHCLIKEFSSESDHNGTMFIRMGQALTSVLRKEVEPLALMMKDNLLFDYYANAYGTHGTYPQVRKLVALLSHKNPDLEYLEIGAGTGACTTPVLEALGGADRRRHPRMKSYTYTDVSSGFFEQAAKKFSQWPDLMKFEKLDIEQDPSKQAGFEERQFDVIVAANVLHATYDIDKTMRHARQLLRPGGKLILLDMTHSVLSLSLIFGNLPGWWNCSESWREYGPLLNEAKWREVLMKTGFTDLQASSPDVLDPLEEQTRLMVATAVEPSPKVERPSALSRALLVHSNKPSSSADILSQQTATAFSNAGLSVNICSLQDSANRDLANTAVVSFAELDEPLLSGPSSDDLKSLQRLGSEAAGLIWITRGGVATKGLRPELSVFHGLARSLRVEREDAPCITVDLDAEYRMSESEVANVLLKIFKQTFALEPVYGSHGVDREFSEDGGAMRIKRAFENPRLNQLVTAETKMTSLQVEQQDLSGITRPLKVSVQSVGKLDSLVFEEDGEIASQPLPEDHVEIEVRAVGLDKRDVLICMGDVVDNHIGNECAGVVTHVGAAVKHVSVGDRVSAWCLGSFATVVRARSLFVQQIPDTMSFSTAAAIPIAFVTAYYGLNQVARVRKNDTVLVLSADTPVGQAAVQIALLYGSRVFASVSTEERRSNLIKTFKLSEGQVMLDSTPSVVDTIRKSTGGRGIDIILSGLSGQAPPFTWDVVTPFGRFIEIAEDAVDLHGSNTATSTKNVAVTTISVNAILRQDPQLAAELFSEVMNLCRSGKVTPASTIFVESFSKAQDSMLRLRDDEHSAKFVLEPRVNDLVPVLPKAAEHITFQPDASYLLSGGLGGIGRSMSRWMAKKGARNLIFVSRRGASSPEASALVRELEASGVRTRVIQCDIADEARLSESISAALETMPPLRGVIQAAMALHDNIFANMSHDAWINSIRPKVQGSWSLHKATMAESLDFFVMLASCVAFIGTAGQSNYVAGGTYQVALAAHRRALGLPATTIDVGKMSNVGVVAENVGGAADRHLTSIGLADVTEEELLVMLEMAMMSSKDEFASDMPNGHFLTGVSPSSDSSKSGELPYWSRDPVFSHMDFVRRRQLGAKSEADGANVEAVQKQQSLPELLGAAGSVREATAHILEALQHKLARSLQMSLEDMDPQKSVSSYGVDSLIAVELRNWFARETKAQVPVFQIVQAKSLAALASKVTAKSTLVKVKE